MVLYLAAGVTGAMLSAPGEGRGWDSPLLGPLPSLLRLGAGRQVVTPLRDSRWVCIRQIWIFLLMVNLHFQVFKFWWHSINWPLPKTPARLRDRRSVCCLLALRPGPVPPGSLE